MTSEREAIGRGLFAISVPLTVLALLCFVLPVIGMVSGNYEGGADGLGFFVIYGLLAFLAGAMLGVGMWLVGWKKAKFAKVSLALLFGLPMIILAIMIAVAVMHSVFGKD